MRRSLDAALVSPGQRTPFPSLDPASVDMTQGVSFCLANNIWGTNCAPCSRPSPVPAASWNLMCASRTAHLH